MKKKTINFFNKLKTKFPDNNQAQEAIDYLKTQIEMWEDEDSSSRGDNSDYPIPSELKSEFDVALFSDGACRGNPGPGSWGCVGQLYSGEILFKASGVETRTTNNRMEMKGAIDAMETLIREREDFKGLNIFLYSDSKYVVEGMKSWIHSWKSKGWTKSDKKPPENVDLWKELDGVSQSFTKIEYIWVKGHAGHPQNELCDQLANEALDDSGF